MKIFFPPLNCFCIISFLSYLLYCFLRTCLWNSEAVHQRQAADDAVGRKLNLVKNYQLHAGHLGDKYSYKHNPVYWVARSINYTLKALLKNPFPVLFPRVVSSWVFIQIEAKEKWKIKLCLILKEGVSSVVDVKCELKNSQNSKSSVH